MLIATGYSDPGGSTPFKCLPVNPECMGGDLGGWHLSGAAGGAFGPPPTCALCPYGLVKVSLYTIVSLLGPARRQVSCGPLVQSGSETSNLPGGLGRPRPVAAGTPSAILPPSGPSG